MQCVADELLRPSKADGLPPRLLRAREHTLGSNPFIARKTGTENSRLIVLFSPKAENQKVNILAAHRLTRRSGFSSFIPRSYGICHSRRFRPRKYKRTSLWQRLSKTHIGACSV